MRLPEFQRVFPSLMIAVMAIVVLGSASPGQNFEFRLASIERRLDQMQNRVDAVEREQRMQSLPASRSDGTREMVLDLQRQQISHAQQMIALQQQLLDMRKAIDRLTTAREEAQESNKPKPAEAPKKKP